MSRSISSEEEVSSIHFEWKVIMIVREVTWSDVSKREDSNNSVMWSGRKTRLCKKHIRENMYGVRRRRRPYKMCFQDVERA